jgi:Fe-S-cluster containining protein
MIKEEPMEIEDLYELLPNLQCIPGCIHCCRNFGVPSRTRVEDERLKSYLRERGRPLGEARGTTCCPYVSEEGCTVYPVRPLTCRLYGTSANYLCELGARPLQPLDEDEEAHLMHLYRTNFF